MQVRQAARFGITCTVIGFAALIWPLVFSLLFGNVAATLVFYAAALVIDFALFIIWLRRALRYSKRAARGETFVLDPMWNAPTRRVPAKR